MQIHFNEVMWRKLSLLFMRGFVYSDLKDIASSVFFYYFELINKQDNSS